MLDTQQEFVELAKHLKHSFIAKPKSYPSLLASALCIAVDQDRKKDALMLLNLLKEYLAEHQLTYLLQPQPAPEMDETTRAMVQGSLF